MIQSVDQIKNRTVEIRCEAFTITCKVLGNASGAVLLECIKSRSKEQIGKITFISFRNFQFQVDEDKLKLADHVPYIRIRGRVTLLNKS